ncbi:GspE/PulE family protein [Alteromonas halophila]|uniref:Type II secretion protein n=1 Tax=Alteromonas halophila TaxID=516698 RepID=A0A918JNW2_9ALTE|nr:GspE/PulE family protein [Alteromonas halophila]GGW92455.1 type II secretion protein [Alteromonas halophila]
MTILTAVTTDFAQVEQTLIATLTADNQLDQKQLEIIDATCKELRCWKVTAISRLGLVGDDTLYEALANTLTWPLVDKINKCPNATAIIASCDMLALNLDWCVEHHVFPVTNEQGDISLYTDMPWASANIRVVTLSAPDKTIHPVLLTPAMAATVEDEVGSERAVSALFGTNTSDIAALAEEAPVINLVNSIVERAIFADASDIHIEPGAKNMVIRFRVDGKMNEFMQQPSSRFPAIASRIKLLSQLDIAERRLPQDGRFSTRAGNREYDVRVSTAPDVNGESIVMRLLPKKRDELSLDALGFADDHLALIREWGKMSNGIILVTGPTGSGKSTTLYGLLSDIKTGEEKIVTVEDPVEYQLDGITQVQARADIGYTFARALRTFLRQDPDVIMVGEIRDKETADIAVQSSLTGHLVLSTLHTNDASSVFPRLADIGVETYLTAATIQGVQAQRLVRKLCPVCSEEAEAPAFLLEGDDFAAIKDKLSAVTWKKAVGCKACHGKGYRGRIGIYELIPVNASIRSLVAAGAEVSKIRQAARKAGFRSLLQDGLMKAASGVTTVDEVLRVCSAEETE